MFTDNFLFPRYLGHPALRDLLRPRCDLLLENLALRQQILVLERQVRGAPRIHGELIMLGYNICESTVAKYMIKRKS